MLIRMETLCLVGLRQFEMCYFMLIVMNAWVIPQHQICKSLRYVIDLYGISRISIW
ncbi:expressed protein [Arabidopsis lyrata subsp. lyrata]|uniref:Expressed protein n=1 Tax=Arabidopsis lyrata subsp. lyrata TaxID=81972 RepID=D7LR51_ARALL|nr:expressed protein [Arabidopsis lyrata subsp. lyrata]